MFDWSKGNKDQHTVLSAAKLPAARKGTEGEREAMHTMNTIPEANKLGPPVQDNTTDQMSPVSMQPQQEVLALAKASVSHGGKLESN
ncbi:hypothetical protein AAES_02911 [Amazona aestiva]|uniref:Uncharacterized protein n=1 Tax=Amazona aestiva TaxID=12930 RepID=A0A0Q3XAP4_AMAAE|nr:hypothetical protein AAES_02911 [Amazona aestiva]